MNNVEEELREYQHRVKEQREQISELQEEILQMQETHISNTLQQMDCYT